MSLLGVGLYDAVGRGVCTVSGVGSRPFGEGGLCHIMEGVYAMMHILKGGLCSAVKGVCAIS